VSVRDLVRLEALRQRLEATNDLSASCREDILRLIFNAAKLAAQGDPLGRYELVADIAREDGGGGDIDHDREVTHLEFLFFLLGPLQTAGLSTEAVDASNTAYAELFDLPGTGLTLCELDRARGDRNLKRALDYAIALSQALPPFVSALDGCRVTIAINPTGATLAPGGQFQFTHTASGALIDPADGAVNWSATGGSVNATGLYTAPSGSGTYQVKATSVVNPKRDAQATVTVFPLNVNDFTTEITSGTCDVPEECNHGEGDITFGLSLSNAAAGTAKVRVSVTTAYSMGTPSTCTDYLSPAFDLPPGQAGHSATVNCHLSGTQPNGASGDRNVIARICVVGSGCGPSDTEVFGIIKGLRGSLAAEPPPALPVLGLRY
jgi:hypothetical protein